MRKVLYFVWTLGFLGILFTVYRIQAFVNASDIKNYQFNPNNPVSWFLYACIGAYLSLIFIRKSISVNYGFLMCTFLPGIVLLFFVKVSNLFPTIDLNIVALFCGFTLLLGLFHSKINLEILK
ncbi:MAG TPA: hypothetical protein VGI33_16155 [Paenibacillus sp.]|jgi:uncharacterized membrane protein AbrB (regulator of aidB expression)